MVLDQKVTPGTQPTACQVRASDAFYVKLGSYDA
jgi:hypothetical protein